MESGGFPGLQNQCDLTVSGRVGSIPIHSRHASFFTQRILPRRCQAWSSRLRLLWSATVLLTLSARVLDAQRPDSARVRRTTPATPTTDTVKPPISPRRAFLYSALLPGYGQAILGRNKAAAVMITVEAVSIAMIRESIEDVREARRMSGDSLVVLSYVNSSTDAGGETTTAPRRFNSSYVHVRQAHVEDWVAFLLANHLFSGADAFVAANLWELPAQLSIRVAPGQATVGASFTW